MSIKVFLIIVVIIAVGIFSYLKIEVMGSPSSNFNQTTRYSLGAHPFLRNLLGLHNAGDARTEILGNTGPIVIQWFKPESDDIDKTVLPAFAELVAKYTGRTVSTNYAGAISDGTVNISNLNSFKFQAAALTPSGSSDLVVFVVQDYSPRAATELSTAYEDSGIILSLNAYRNFLQFYQGKLDQHLLAGMLEQFGAQIGLKTTSSDPTCVMYQGDLANFQPLESINRTEPQDFCPAEVEEINKIKVSI